MALLIALLVGLFVGVLAGYLIHGSFDLLAMNIVFGIAGSIAGQCAYALFGPDELSTLFSWTAVLFQIVGATLLLLLFGVLHHKAPKAL